MNKIDAIKLEIMRYNYFEHIKRSKEIFPIVSSEENPERKSLDSAMNQLLPQIQAIEKSLRKDKNK